MGGYGIHITHNDADAVGCALVASLYREQGYWKTYFCPTTGADEKLKEIWGNIQSGELPVPDEILITDISIKTQESLDILEKFRVEGCVEILSMDHHPTNPNKDKDWMIFKTEMTYDGRTEKISAAKIVYDFFEEEYCNRNNIDKNDSFSGMNESLWEFPTLQEYQDNRHKAWRYMLNYLVMQISRYDTWEWKNNPIDEEDSYISEDVIALLTKCFGPQLIYEELFDYFSIGLVDRIYHLLLTVSKDAYDCVKLIYPEMYLVRYEALKQEESRCTTIEHINRYTKVYQKGEYIFASYISSNQHSNAIAEAIYNAYNGVDIVIVLYPDSLRIGLRSKLDNVDVGRYCERIYGGGGHPQAAGAPVDASDMMYLLEEHYNGEPITTLIKE